MDAKVGDHVGVPWGLITVQAVVVEDRGYLGAKHILRVRLITADDDGLEFDFPADGLTAFGEAEPIAG